MDLLALADFTLVARHAGFGKAARASGRPKATLSRRVAELEAALGLRLFERGGRDLTLTDEGRALYERSAALLRELDEAVTTVAQGGERPRGVLRISAPLLFAQMAMGKLAASFAARFPEVQLEVTTEDRQVDMIEEGYELVIRVNPRPDERLVGRAFLHDRRVVVAAPQVERPQGDRPIASIIRPIERSRGEWRIRGQAAPLATVPQLVLSSNMMVRDAARAGAGVACLPISLAHHDLRNGRLVSWGELDEAPVALWALYPSRRLLSARVKAFLAHLAAAFPSGQPEELAAFLDE